MVDRSVQIRLGLDPSAFNRGLAVAATSARAFTNELNTSNNRMVALTQSALALGPALIPVGAAAAGAITGLAEALGAAAAGAAVAALAFDGVGDALKALNDFQLDPTSTHFEKLQQTMSKIGPAGQEFVLFVDELQPKLQRLKDTAQQGLFPGVEEGLTQLVQLAPQVDNVVSSLSTAMGQLADEGGAALNTPFWKDFLNFVATDGRDTLLQFGQIIGSLAKAAASLIEAFHPLSADVGDALVNQARAFAEWSANLDQTSGFQAFVNYVRTISPQVWDTLGSLGEALVALTQAAAQVAPVSLLLIKTLAETITTIASSPAGPVLIGVAAGISAIARAIALTRLAGGSAFATLLFGKEGTSNLGILGARGISQRTVALRGLAGAVGLLALSMTDLDDSLGLQNTATGTALGFAVGGPIGAGIGAVIGQIKDLEDANSSLSDSFADLDANALATLSPADFGAKVDQINAQIDSIGQHQESMLGIGGSFLQDHAHLTGGLGVIGNFVSDKLIGDTSDAEQQLQDLIDKRDELFGTPPADVFGIKSGVQSFASDVGKALDSLPAKSLAVGQAMAALRGDVEDTTTATEDLSNALDELFDPALNLSAARDQLAQDLHDLTDNLNKNSKALFGQTQAARDNRAPIRALVGDIKDLVVAQATAHPNGDKWVQTLHDQRKALIDAGVAAGIAKDDMVKLLAQYNLTPENIETTIRANTHPALEAAQDLIRQINGKVAYITIKSINQTATSQQAAHDARTNADGSVTRYYGMGGVEHHVAQIAPRGVMRVWNEPETGGEAYIPLAMSKRPRSRSITEHVARELGGMVQWFAGGGIRPSAQAPVVNVAGSSVSLAGMRVQIDTGQGTFWGTVRDVARTEYDAQQSYDASNRRQR